MANLARTDRVERHGIKRARQRYGASPEVVDKVRRQIRRALKDMKRRPRGGGPRPIPTATRIMIETPSRSLWRVELDGETYIVVFEEPTQVIVTFLPKDYRP